LKRQVVAAAAAGLGMSFDIEPLDAPGATGSYDSDFASKAAVACSALVNGGFDFALLHVKAVDDTGHDRMLAMKVMIQYALRSLASRYCGHSQLFVVDA
jgi:2,3-bisphosphoglycerate-independent phosphoglycerate mutase